MLKKIDIKTSSRVEFVDITARVLEAVGASGVASGTCRVYCPHTTAGITVNEHADPAVAADIAAGLDRAVPQNESYRHAEGNSPAHIKASLMGASATLFVEGGTLALGTWQGVFLAEFDGPRRRQVWVKVTED